MKTKPTTKQIQVKKNRFKQGTFNLAKDTLPPGTFTVGGNVYPKSQFAEVLSFWFQDKPLPSSRLP
jgi:hypothetical protein